MKNAIMKFPLLTLASCGALALTAVSSFAQTAVTGALGYYTFDVPTGNSLWVCGLVTKADFSGAMLGITLDAPNSTIAQTGAAWVSGGFANHYVEIKEGPMEGLILDIVGNDENSLTVEGDLLAAPPSGYGLNGDEKYSIHKHATLGTLFPGGGGLAAFTDSVRLFFSDGSDKTYLYSGSNWVDGLFQNSDDVAVYPGQGMVFTVGGVRSVTFGGNEISTVKSSPTLVPVYSGQINLLGAINPLVTTDAGDPLFGKSVPLGADDAATTGVIENGVGVKDVFTPFTDSVRLFARDGLLTDQGTFLYSGSNMIDGLFQNSDSVGILTGSAFVVSVGGDKLVKIPSFVP